MRQSASKRVWAVSDGLGPDTRRHVLPLGLRWQGRKRLSEFVRRPCKGNYYKCQVRGAREMKEKKIKVPKLPKRKRKKKHLKVPKVKKEK